MTEVVTAFIGAITAIAVYYLSARDLKRQDREAKRREIRLQFLIEAYRQIEYSSNRPRKEMTEALNTIECAISDIQLFGTRRQVTLAQEVVTKAACGEDMFFDDLLDELRRDLRSELEIEALPEGRRILRFTKLDSEQGTAPNDSPATPKRGSNGAGAGRNR